MNDVNRSGRAGPHALGSAPALALLLATAIAGAGCISAPRPTYEQTAHLLLVDKNGYFVETPAGKRIRSRGEAADYAALEREVFDALSGRKNVIVEPFTAALVRMFRAIEAAYQASSPDPAERELTLTFSIHGGLTSHEAAVRDALYRMNEMQNGGPPTFPIFVIWDSRGVSSYFDRVFRIRGGYRTKAAAFTGPAYLGTDIARTLANTPLAYGVQGLHSVAGMFNQKCRLIPKPRDAEDGGERQGEDDEQQLDTAAWVVSHGKTEGRCSRPFRAAMWAFPGWLGKPLTTPIAHTLGGEAWRVMLRRSEQLFRVPDHYEGTAYNRSLLNRSADTGKGPAARPDMQSRGVLADTLRLLQRFLEDELLSSKVYELPPKQREILTADRQAARASAQLKRPEPGKGIRIDLIGHSMGAIIVNRILERSFAGDYHLPIRNIVHMGSADSIISIESSVIPYLRTKNVDVIKSMRNGNTRCHPPNGTHEEQYPDATVCYYNLMLHPKHEDGEMNYLAQVPSGSLLTYIDNMYAQPETAAHRRAGAWNNVRKWLPLVPCDVGPFMTFKVFGFDEEGAPEKHGEFDDRKFWEPSYWTAPAKLVRKCPYPNGESADSA